MAGPLEGIRILDFTWILSGPYATMVLCDLGAEVIKVERVQRGDTVRGNGPFVDGVSSYFFSLNRGKKSLTLDLKSPRGKEIIFRLAKEVDVLVENFVPGTMDRLGLGYKVIQKLNPRLIYASCSGFGQTGPYAQKPALDVIIQGTGGIMSITGEPEGPPIRPGASLGDIVAGLFLAIGILAALQERSRSGQGQRIDISMLDCQVALLENAFVRYFATGEIPRPLGTRHPVYTPFQAFQTKDGYMVLAMTEGVENQWALFCDKIGRLDLIDDERFQTGALRTEHYQELEPILTKAMRTRTTREWVQELEEVGIACGPINTIDQVAEDPQVVAREAIVELPLPTGGSLKVANTPIKLSRTPCRVDRPSPELGEHSQEVLRGLLEMTQAEVEELRKTQVL